MLQNTANFHSGVYDPNGSEGLFFLELFVDEDAINCGGEELKNPPSTVEESRSDEALVPSIGNDRHEQREASQSSTNDHLHKGTDVRERERERERERRECGREIGKRWRGDNVRMGCFLDLENESISERNGYEIQRETEMGAF